MHKLQKRQIPKRSRANCVTIQLTVRTWSHEPGKQCACPVSRLVHSPGSPASVITWKISTQDSGITIPGSYICTVPQMILRPQMISKMDHKWSLTASDPQSRPQMIPWKIEDGNGFYETGYKKGQIITERNLIFSRLIIKGKGDATSQVNLYKAKKKNVINLKRIWYQPYTFSFVNCFKFLSIMFRRYNNLRQTGRAEKNSIIPLVLI